jgi:diguanylate cyclase (GGDEF)-like protein
VILAINLDRQYTEKVFERIRAHIETDKLEYGGVPIELTASIGVTTKIMNTLEETIKRADEMLYQAKQMGRNRVVCD